MKYLLSASTLLFLSALTFAGPVAGVVLFEGEGFQGRCIVLDNDVARMEWTELGNDRVRSVIVPRGFEVTLYEHENFLGRETVLLQDAADLGRTRIGRDRVSSARVRLIGGHNYNPVHRDRGVVLFEHEGFSGRRGEFFDDVANLRHSSIGNDRASSISVPDGYVAVLFEHADFRGRSLTVRNDIRDLRKTFIGSDRVSSIRVFWAGRETVRDARDERRGRVDRAAYRESDRRPVADIRHGVALFEHHNFRGECVILNQDLANLGRTALGNRSASSIQVPPGYRVTLYSRANFRGKSVTLGQDLKDLGSTPVGNDRVASVRVEWVGF